MGSQRSHIGIAQLGKFAAAHRLHHPDGNIVLGEQFTLALGILQRPIQIVQLNLAEFNVLAVNIQKLLDGIVGCMGGKAQMTDAALLFLLHKVIHDAPLGRGVGGHGKFAHVVQQIEIKILHAALFELVFKNVSGVIGGGKLMAGILVRQIIAFAGILFEDTADDHFAQTAVIGVGGIEIVNAVRHGVIDHFFGVLLIDLIGAGDEGQTHGAKAQQGQLLLLKIGVDHD